MSFFCLLWVPLFYLFRRSFSQSGTSGGVWALLLGSITAIIQFFLGYIVSPGGFGFSRWFFGFVEIVSMPVLTPLLLYLLMYLVRGVSGEVEFANFAMLWLIPTAALRAISWSASYDTILLVAVPMLWTALAVGIPFFINIVLSDPRWYTAILSVVCILLLPALGALTYWAFFSQQTLLGFLLLAATHIPMALSFGYDISHT